MERTNISSLNKQVGNALRQAGSRQASNDHDVNSDGYIIYLPPRSGYHQLAYRQPPSITPQPLHGALQEERSNGTNTSNEATDLGVAGSTSELGWRRAVGTSARRSSSADLRGKRSADTSAGGDNGGDGAAGRVGSRRGNGEGGRGAGGVNAVGESPALC